MQANGMRVQWYMWVMLALILAPLVQQWVATYFPAESYPLAALVVVVIGGVAKWLELVMEERGARGETRQPAMGEAGEVAAAAAPVVSEGRARWKRLVWDER